ncbi:spherulation-specific family 4 protein [Aquisphaera insulae]|uniref:spherulation-specific family 4 protein n=1 Tax=Aquisphaera insulae TaxID=2712864 RepID=UPI0013EAC749|nr:spherulation-specific family 4 protein [Aquisphaera insulae]
MRRMRGGRSRPVIRILATIALAASFGVAAKAGSVVELLIPAYFAPGTGGAGGVGDGWAQMTDAAKSVSLTAIMNPASGPGSIGQVNAYAAAVKGVQDNGGKVIGYIDTSYGAIPFDTIKAAIQTYLASDVHVNGFFLDQVNSPISLAYYSQIYGYIKSLNPAYEVVGNPGTPFLNGVAPSDFLSVADTMVAFEGPHTGPPGAIGFNNYPYGLDWMTQPGVARSSIANLVYETPDADAMRADLLKAYGLNAGSVYFTDDTPLNPWDRLPTYWNDEVAAVAALAVPEPTSVSLLALGLLCGGLALRRGPGLVTR